MAAADRITIEIEGRGGHAARPHISVDPILVGAQIINQIQSIVSRNVDPVHAAVITITVFRAGSADNVIPPKTQQEMADVAGPRVSLIAAPHLSMLAKPAAVENVIKQAAEAVN